MTTTTRLKGSAGDNGDRGGFIALSVIGFLDSGARGAGLTFLPFIMEDDVNGDGRITREEIPEQAGGMFDRGDINGDDVITEDELNTMAGRRRGRGSR